MKAIILLIMLINPLIIAQEMQNNKGDKIKPALIIIDIQNDFIPKMSEQEKKYAFQVINGSIWVFRQNNLPIIRVYHSDINWGPFDGSEEFSYPKSVIIKDSDLKIIKHFPSAFTKTELDSILKKLDCNTLFLCGLSATGCVLATYFGGVERGYHTLLIRDGVMSHDPDYTHVITDICNSVNFESVMFLVKNSK